MDDPAAIVTLDVAPKAADGSDAPQGPPLHFRQYQVRLLLPVGAGLLAALLRLQRPWTCRKPAACSLPGSPPVHGEPRLACRREPCRLSAAAAGQEFEWIVHTIHYAAGHLQV